MNEYEMNQGAGSRNEYQPVIDRLREIASRGMRRNPEDVDPAMLRQYELAGSQGGQMMGKEALDSLQQLMGNPEVMRRMKDWMNESGMMEQHSQNPEQAASLPGMPPPQSFPDGSTPYSRLQDRINSIGRGNAPGRRNGGNGNGGY